MADSYNSDLTSQYKRLEKAITKTLDRTVSKLEAALAKNQD